uniref:PS II complex 12 kDa extrinsic protein n=1 Tax=Alexandrium andersonii TaxID=327968 RepID=A0A7S2GM36_9DINO|mmetsp:Transcript_58274/g.131051  ORF Transcript_58274/g.131051 Transcript_58274/m.131051 type:complete len:166 (+) Transcript_58274:85-582(+)
MLAFAFAAVIAMALCRPADSTGGLRLRGGAAAGRVLAAVSGNATYEWFGNMTPAMNAAYFHARQNTTPVIKPNVTDDVWYSTYYAFDVNNPLMNLSYFSPAVKPTAEQVAKEKAKEKAAMAALMPMIKAESAEAEHYYKYVYPFRENNDLEEFTYGRNYSNASAR